MERTAKISNVRFIKASEKVSEPFVIIDLANGKPSIIRTVSQFLIDLEESGLTVGAIPHLNHPKAVKAKRHLRGGLVTGNFIHTKAGDKYTVTENSRVLTDKSHPMFGKVTVGQELVSEKDRTIVEEGFLFLERSERYETIVENADAYAEHKASMDSMFDIPTASTEDVEQEEVAQDVVDAVMKDAPTKTDKK